MRGGKFRTFVSKSQLSPFYFLFIQTKENIFCVFSLLFSFSSSKQSIRFSENHLNPILSKGWMCLKLVWFWNSQLFVFCNFFICSFIQSLLVWLSCCFLHCYVNLVSVSISSSKSIVAIHLFEDLICGISQCS